MCRVINSPALKSQISWHSYCSASIDPQTKYGNEEIAHSFPNCSTTSDKPAHAVLDICFGPLETA